MKIPGRNIMSDINELSFEQALKELESIVQGLESGDAPLDTAISAYERGSALRQHCNKKLQEAKSRVDKIIVANDGSVSTSPLEKM